MKIKEKKTTNNNIFDYYFCTFVDWFMLYIQYNHHMLYTYISQKGPLDNRIENFCFSLFSFCSFNFKFLFILQICLIGVKILIQNYIC